jgi:hypothetical protein
MFKAPLLIHQFTLFNQYSDAFRRSSAPSTVSNILTFKFPDTLNGYKLLSNYVMQNWSLLKDTQILKLHKVRFEINSENLVVLCCDIVYCDG